MDPRTMDCGDWAKEKLKSLADKSVVQVLEIRPKPPARVLAGILSLDGRMSWPYPPWHHHIAVFADGLVHDELHPDGIPLGQYKQKFEHQDAIDFILRRP